MRQAAHIDDRIIGQVFSVGSERQRTSFLKERQVNLELFLSLVWGHLPHAPEAVQAALELVLRRKAISAEVQAAQRDAVLGGKYPDLQPQLHQWSTLRRQIARKTLAGPGLEGPRVHQQQLAQWHEQRERLEAELARQIPEMNLEQQLRAADRRAVALALPEGVSLLEFVRFNVFDFKAVAARGERPWRPARYLAFLLAASQPDNVRLIDLGAAEPIDQLIELFRAGVSELPEARNMVRRPPTASPLSSEQAGQQLRIAVFDPLRAALGDCRQLLLSPDGNLTRLPFATLPNADGGLLMDAYQISYVNCGRDVLRFGAASSGTPSAAVVVTDPDFDLAASAAAVPRTEEGRGRISRDLPRDRLHFGRLPGTRAEGEAIASLLGVPPWQDSAALEARLKRECVSPRILHLATHGFFLEDQKHDPNQEQCSLSGEGRLSGPLPENPLLRSGLALAGANTFLRGGTPPEEAQDGLLTAEDVSGLDLLATELVVLSACETGLGEVRTGEGVFGLQRAFTLAGAKTLVMSLWSVPDDATRELMEDFYRRILAGAGRADALRDAQLKLRQKYPDPYFWGAFICQGDPAPVSAS
jgi:CHAT domain-containing protein